MHMIAIDRRDMGILGLLMLGLMMGQVAWVQAAAARKIVAFDEIDVQRINIREPDGTLRMVISNTDAAPGVLVKGKEYPHPTRATAGIFFMNAEGTENGALIFDGAKKNGICCSSSTTRRKGRSRSGNSRSPTPSVFSGSCWARPSSAIQSWSSRTTKAARGSC
jgi:hypothetical protein